MAEQVQVQEMEPMNQDALVRVDSAALTAQEIRTQVNRIQEVMQEVMAEGTHFGKIPGTDKPSLWKPGAEKLALTFKIALDSIVDADLSTDDAIRYRIRTTATSQQSGVFLGSSLGECSSNEEKYRWRQAICQAEWEETEVDRRRKKWRRDGTHVPQVRTQPADIANTVLKMATKRAEVATMLKVCAASDIFAQDLEDLPEEVRQEVVNGNGGNGHTKAAAAPPPPPPPQQASAPSGNVISEAQAKRLYAIRKGRGWTDEQMNQLLQVHAIPDDRSIPRRHYDAIVAIVEKYTCQEYLDLKTNR
jgi:hypothetical protein